MHHIDQHLYVTYIHQYQIWKLPKQELTLTGNEYPPKDPNHNPRMHRCWVITGWPGWPIARSSAGCQLAGCLPRSVACWRSQYALV